jgi:hypothetical protein
LETILNFESNILNNIGSISSIIGIVISLVTIIINIVILSKVNNIKKSFVRKIRYNEILKDIKTKTSKLSKIVFSFEDNKENIREVFSEIKAILKSINSKEKDKDLDELKELIISKLVSITTLTQFKSEEIYNDLIEFQSMLEQKIKDMKWEDNE